MDMLISAINVVTMGSINILLIYAAATVVGLRVMFPTLIKRENVIVILYVILVGTFLCTMFSINELFNMQSLKVVPTLTGVY